MMSALAKKLLAKESKTSCTRGTPINKRAEMATINDKRSLNQGFETVLNILLYLFGT